MRGEFRTQSIIKMGLFKKIDNGFSSLNEMNGF